MFLPRIFRAKDHLGWSYSFNPCASFKEGSPSRGDCQSDVAICRWDSNQYIKIGSQSTEECSYNKNTKKLKLQYSCGEWKAFVFLKCDPNEEEGTFNVRKYERTDDFEFTLKHQCACANSCLFKPSTHTTKEPTATTDSNDRAAPIVASVFGVLCLVIVPIIVWRFLRRPPNNERQYLLDQNNEDHVIENHFPGGSEEVN